MSSENPQVTVLLPVRNGALHLPEALASIFAQTFTDFELLVIDDGSTDATAEILRAVRDPRLRVVTHPQNFGLVPTLNEGLSLARGSLVARQDHDDISHPERLQRQVDFLRDQPECVLVGTQAWQTDEQGRQSFRLLRPLTAESIRWYLCFDNAFIHSTVMFHRAVIRDEFGGYEASFHSEDYALWSRVARVRSVANLPEPLLHYREHGSSITGGMSANAAAAFDEATKAIRQMNLQHFALGKGVEDDAEILTSYRRPFTAASATAFQFFLERQLTVAGSPLASSPDGRRTIALQYAELAYRVLPVHRWKAFCLYIRGLRWDASLRTEIPWRRVAGLFLLGPRARPLYLWWSGSR